MVEAYQLLVSLIGPAGGGWWVAEAGDQSEWVLLGTELRERGREKRPRGWSD